MKFRTALSVALSLLFVVPAYGGRRRCADTALPRAEIRPLDAVEAESILQRAKQKLDPAQQAVWGPPLNQILTGTRSEDAPLLLVLLGATNSGKSTLFNLLPSFYREPAQQKARKQDPLSTTGYSGATTQRPVLLFNGEKVSVETLMADLRLVNVETWRSANDTVRAGPPLLLPQSKFFPDLVVADTPAYDLGRFAPMTAQVMARADTVILTFEPATYMNETQVSYLRDFYRKHGSRKTILVYRVPADMPTEVADKHLYEVANSLFPEGEPFSPTSVIAAYQMVRRQDLVELSPRAASPPLGRILETLNENAVRVRELTSENDREAGLRELRRWVVSERKHLDELRFSQKVVDRYLKSVMTELVRDLPYDRLAKELEEVWYSRSQGMRNFANWVAHPWQMIKGRGTELRIDGTGLQSLQRALNNTVDQLIIRVQLSAAHGSFRLPIESPFNTELKENWERIVREFEMPVESGSVIRDLGNEVEYKLPESGRVKEYLKEMATLDWQGVGRVVKEESQVHLANLAVQSQAELSRIAKRQGLLRRSAGSFLTVMAILPTVGSFAYIVQQGQILDVKPLASLLGAHLLAKVFVHFDEVNLKRGWDKAIEEWYSEKQEPQLAATLLKHLTPRERGAHASTSDLQLIEYAIEVLQKPTPHEPD